LLIFVHSLWQGFRGKGFINTPSTASNKARVDQRGARGRHNAAASSAPMRMGADPEGKGREAGDCNTERTLFV